MSDFGSIPTQGSVTGQGTRCFLPERRYFGLVLHRAREALAADSQHGAETLGFRCVAEAVEYDDDIEQATNVAMLAELSGAEAEELAFVLRELGASSSAEVVAAMRVAYAACVRELHAARRLAVGEGILEELAIQLVDPIRALPRPTATFTTAKVLVELLSYAGLKLDARLATLYIRVFHPNSRVGSVKALQTLVADHQAAPEVGQRSASVWLESTADMRRRRGRGKGGNTDRARPRRLSGQEEV